MTQQPPRTHSSLQDTSWARKAKESLQMFRAALRRRAAGASTYQSVFDDMARYGAHTRRFVGRPIEQCKVLEIEFGQRPYRLYTLHAHGVDVTGVDLDQPMLGWRSLPDIYRRNGAFRALKSAVRHLLVDNVETPEFFKTLSEKTGKRFQPPLERLIVADAGDPGFWQSHPGPYDLIISEDVFEHIPEASLEEVVRRMRENLSPDGVAVICPMIFTGILGGHVVELYLAPGEDRERNVPAWDHLRQRQFHADTYLNELPRKRYRQIFSENFDIVSELETKPGHGRDYLTPEIRRELAQYDEDELLSNKVEFVLRHKGRTAV